MHQASWLHGLVNAVGGGFSWDAQRLRRLLRRTPRGLRAAASSPGSDAGEGQAPPQQARAPTQCAAPRAIATGSVVHDKYRLVELLSAGGMGMVFKARHTHINLEFVVKVPNLHDVGSERLESRFANEAHALASIRHDHVVKIIDAGRDPSSGSLYLVEELLHGWDLRACMARNGPFSVPDALQVMLPIMSALAEMHRLGMIHRDVKPENIFLVHAKGGAVTSKLIDLGITRIMNDARSDERPTSKISTEAFQRLRPQSTARGERIGTRAYMAPEQFYGGDIDERTDVWGVGATLYAMLLGDLPFRDVWSDHDAIAQRLGLARLESRVRGVSSAVADVIHKALRVNPDERHASMSRFIEALVDAADLVPRMHWPTAPTLSHLAPRSRHAPRAAAPPTEPDPASTGGPSSAHPSRSGDASVYAQTDALAERLEKTIARASHFPSVPTVRDDWCPTEPMAPECPAARPPVASTARVFAGGSIVRTCIGLSATLVVTTFSVVTMIRPLQARPPFSSAARPSGPVSTPPVVSPRATLQVLERPVATVTAPPPRRGIASDLALHRAPVHRVRPTAVAPVHRAVAAPSTPGRGIYRDVPRELMLPWPAMARR